ncbi:MAG: hypothetical protein ABSG15_09820 [FCB group bacterium]|jgi:hypothetical protein
MCKKNIIIFFFFLLIFFSCKYEPTGTSYTYINPNYKPAEIVIKLPYGKDTVYLDAGYVPYVSYDLTGETDKLVQVYLFLDTVLVKQSKNRQEYSIPVNVRIDSIFNHYIMTLIATTHSGTGSLADIMGAEGAVYVKKWALITFNRRLFKPPPISFERVDGKLKIKWEKYPFPDGLIIYIEKGFDGYRPFHIDLKSVTPYQDSTFDESYVGERTEYYVSVSTNNTDGFAYTTAWCDKDLPVLKYEKIDTYKYRLYWDKCKYPGNFSEYQLSCTDNNYFENLSIKDINTCEYIIDNYYFGRNETFYIGVASSYKPGSYRITGDNMMNSLNICNGEPSFRFDRVYSASNDMIVYSYDHATNKEKFYLYDVNKNSITDSLDFENSSSFISVSKGGKYMLINNYQDIILKSFDNSLQGGTKFTADEIWGSSVGSSFMYSAVADNGNGVFRYKGLCVYDLINRKLLAKAPDIDGNVKISSDSKYIIARDSYGKSSVLRFENNTLTTLITNSQVAFLDFVPGQTNRVFAQDAQKYGVYDLDKQSFITTINIKGNYYGLEYESGWLCSGESNYHKFYIYDINNNFALVSEINCDDLNAYGVYKDYIYSSNGIKMKFR